MYSLDEYRSMVEEALVALKLPADPAGLYDPVRYIIQLGGKRIRPCLVLMAADLAGGNTKDAMQAALAIEMFHNFSLLHDDLMDDAPLRRGQPTVHEKWSADTAVLSGDVMMVQAWQKISTTRPDVLSDVLRVFGRTAVEVCEGQQYDMDFESLSTVRKSEYLEMIRLKTAVLLGASLWIGARIGGADENQCESLYHFGQELGISFQLQDDLLDTYGDPEKFGKTVGGDIMQDKKTFLLISALERASGAEQKVLHKWIGNKLTEREMASTEARISMKKKVSEVTAVYDALGIRDTTNAAINSYFEKARVALNSSGIPLDQLKPLKELANRLLMRQS